MDGFQQLTSFAKRTLLDVWLGSGYASTIYLVFLKYLSYVEKVHNEDLIKIKIRKSSSAMQREFCLHLVDSLGKKYKGVLCCIDL